MKTDVVFVRPSDSVLSAAEIMEQRNVGFLPVCSDERKVIGALTDRDLALRCLAHDRPATTDVRDVMTREVVACRPDDDVLVAELVMAKYRKSRVVCVDERGDLLGVISVSDLPARVGSEEAGNVLERIVEREART